MFEDCSSGGSRVFLRGEPTIKVGVLTYVFAVNCMKMKEFGPPCLPGAPLDPLRGWQMSCSIYYIWRFMVLQMFDCS